VNAKRRLLSAIIQNDPCCIPVRLINLVDGTHSATRDEASRAEEPAQVCSDESQAAESAVSAES
jgi:hypothetical protein